ncbi:hypothetical protein EYF80_046892 [Liparis tanakae]|uniref:Uncharacterized protein n=1 Tax=Liparis tanakae TaxID=230148 RepID=A0A4Z2FP63_9TELE|nr:hypothetical protein EYF80_046892 [Liparis tanakae]
MEEQWRNNGGRTDVFLLPSTHQMTRCCGAEEERLSSEAPPPLRVGAEVIGQLATHLLHRPEGVALLWVINGQNETVKRDISNRQEVNKSSEDHWSKE